MQHHAADSAAINNTFFFIRFAGRYMVRLRGILALLFTTACVCASGIGDTEKMLFPVDWSGTCALRSGNYSEALKNILVEADSCNQLFRDFKLAYIYFQLENYSTSLNLFRKVIENNPELIPPAYIYIAEIEQRLGRTANALAAYRTVLRHDIPQRFRGYIFEKLHQLLEADSTITLAETPWLEEYFQWQPASQEITEDFTVDTIETFFRQGLLPQAESLIVNVTFSGKAKCTFTAFADSSGITERLGVAALYQCARMAHACGELPFAEALYKKIRKRRHYQDTVSERLFLRSYAELLFDKQEWQESIKENRKYVAKYGNDADVFFAIARAYRKIDRNSEAASWYDRLMAAFPRHPKTEEILWLRAWQHEDRGDYRGAASYYKTIYTRTKKGTRIDESYLRQALCYYRLAKYDSALIILDQFEKRLPYSSFAAAGLYWQSKCLLARHKNEDALLELRLLSYKEPFDYYAHRARQLLIELHDTARIAIDTTLSTEQVLSWFDSLTALTDQKKNLSQSDSVSLYCGTMLAMVGDIEKADFFIEPIELGFPGNLTLQYKLINLYNTVGATAQAYRIARRLTWRIPQESRTELSLEIYKLFYPPFYSGFITKEARQYSVDPCLISGIIRQESIFNPKIVSPAGAIGLMQIMPYTGKVLAKKTNTPFAAESLYQPTYNIRFGIYYVNELLKQYDGNPILALAGYNAGPHNASRWEKMNAKKEMDLFVEDIGFTETRGYVKKVMANYWTYQILGRYPSYQYGKHHSTNSPPLIRTSDSGIR